MKYIDFSDTSLFSLTFHQLVDSYNEFERHIYDNISNLALKFIETLGGEIKGELFLINGQYFSFKVPFDETTRALSICLVPVDIVPKRDFKEKEIKINELGRIKSVIVYAHNDYFTQLLDLSVGLAKIIRSEYLKYEQVFATKYEHSNNLLTNGLYEIINAAIILNNKNQLIDNYYISITKLATVAEEKSYYGFSLTKQSLPTIISNLKSTQVNTYSPLDFLIHLITSNVFDEGMDLYKDGVFTSSIGFEEMQTKKLENFKFWRAEKIIYNDSAANAFYYFAQEKDYLLSCDHSVKYHDDIKSIMELTKKDLQEQFRNNLSKYKGGFKKTKERKGKFLNFFREFFLDYGAKVTAEMLKP